MLSIWSYENCANNHFNGNGKFHRFHTHFVNTLVSFISFFFFFVNFSISSAQIWPESLTHKTSNALVSVSVVFSFLFFLMVLLFLPEGSIARTPINLFTNLERKLSHYIRATKHTVKMSDDDNDKGKRKKNI